MKKIILIIVFATINIYSKAYCSENDLYNFFWLDPDKKVYVLQNKYFKNSKKLFLSLKYLSNTSNNYKSVTGLGLELAYYFNEISGIELEGNFFSNKDSDSLKTLMEINHQVPFIRVSKSYIGLNYLWVPFYGKVNTFNKIIYLDWGFGAGIGSLKAESNAETVAISNNLNFKAETFLSGKLKTFLKINIDKKYFLKISLERNIFKAPGPKRSNGAQSNSYKTDDNVAVSFGIGF